VDPKELFKGFSRETEIRRDARGRWYMGADPITHRGVVQAFNGWIDRAEDGRYCLRNDLGWAYVTIEGSPYFVRSISHRGDEIELTLSGGRQERLALETLCQGPAGRLYCRVLEGRLVAEFDNHSAVTLADHVEEVRGGHWLRCDGRLHAIPVVADPDGKGPVTGSMVGSPRD